MKSSVLYGILASLITMIAMYLDQKLFDNPKTKATYLKNMLFVGLLIWAGISYLIGDANFNKAIGSNSKPNYQTGFGYIGGIGEEIITGSPNF